MPERFDPYYHWLGIPPKDQPPNHYRLLQLQDFEPNSDVIQNAVDRTMVHLRTFQTGRRGAASQMLLNEVARAKICLLDAEKKAAYDAQLRAEETPVPAPPTERTSAPPQPAEPPLESAATIRLRGSSATERGARRRRRRLTIAAVMLAVAAITSVVVWQSRWHRSRGGVWSNVTDPAPQSRQRRAPNRNKQPDQGKQQQPAKPTPGNPTTDGTTNSTGGGMHATSPDKMNPSVPGEHAGLAPPSPAPSVLTPSVLRELEAASGLATPRFALVQRLPWLEFRPLAERMRPHRYRPIRIRPYVVADRAYVAALWVHDDRDWRVEFDTSADALQELSATLTHQSMVPVDIAGVATDRTYYVAIYARNTAAEIDIRVDIGIDAQQREALTTARKQAGYRLTTLQQFTDGAGNTRYCRIWIHGDSKDTWFRVGGVLRPERPMFADISPPFFPVDLSVDLHQRDTDTVVVWEAVASRTEHPIAVLSGFAPQSHLDRVRELDARGYLPIAISVVPLRGTLMACSAWYVDTNPAQSELPTYRQLAGTSFAGGTGKGAGSVVPTAPVPDTPRPLLPVPSDDELKGTRAAFSAKYATLLDDTAPTADQLSAVRELLQTVDQEDDPLLQYQALTRSRDCAQRAGHIRLALQAIDALATRFQIAAARQQESAITTVLKAVRARPARYALASMAFEMSDRLRAEQRFADAQRLAAVASTAARTVRDRHLSRATLAQTKRLESARKLQTEWQQAKQTLAGDADDGPANLHAGNYYCFAANQWQQGLAYLTKSQVKLIAELAQLDLDCPTEAAAQLTVAKKWADWSKGKSTEVLIGALQRARYWYAHAIPLLPTDAQPAVEKDLAKVDERLASWIWSSARQLPWFDGAPGVLRKLPVNMRYAPLVATPLNARLAVLAGRRGDLVFWDLVTGREIDRRSSGLSPLSRISMSGDSPLVVGSNLGRDIVVINLGTGQTAIQRQPLSVTQFAASYWEPAFAWAVQASEKNSVSFWQVGQSGRPPSWPTSTTVTALAIGPSSRTVIAGDSNNALVFYDAVTGSESGRIALPSAPQSVSSSADGCSLLVRLSNQFVVYDTVFGDEVVQLPTDYTIAAFTTRSNILVATDSVGSRLDLWDLNRGAVVSSVTVQDGRVPVRCERILPLSDPRAVIVTARGAAYLVRLPN